MAQPIFSDRSKFGYDFNFQRPSFVAEDGSSIFGFTAPDKPKTFVIQRRNPQTGAGYIELYKGNTISRANTGGNIRGMPDIKEKKFWRLKDNPAVALDDMNKGDYQKLLKKNKAKGLMDLVDSGAVYLNRGMWNDIKKAYDKEWDDFTQSGYQPIGWAGMDYREVLINDPESKKKLGKESFEKIKIPWGGFFAFKDKDTSINALADWIKRKYFDTGKAESLYGLSKTYAPASDNNNPARYANFIRKRLDKAGYKIPSINSKVLQKYKDDDKFMKILAQAKYKFEGGGGPVEKTATQVMNREDAKKSLPSRIKKDAILQKGNKNNFGYKRRRD